jgi:hypothetical protein
MDSYQGVALGVESAWPALLDGYADSVAAATRAEPCVMPGSQRDRNVAQAFSTEEKVSI